MQKKRKQYYFSSLINRTVSLPVPTNDLRELISTTMAALRSQWSHAATYFYKKAGVIVTDICPDNAIQPDLFDNEFDYRETANWQDLQNLAMAYFTLITSPYEVTSGGGGGPQSDLPWGRDSKEDEIDFARRCARMAVSKMGIQKKSGRKR